MESRSSTLCPKEKGAFYVPVDLPQKGILQRQKIRGRIPADGTNGTPFLLIKSLVFVLHRLSLGL